MEKYECEIYCNKQQMYFIVEEIILRCVLFFFFDIMQLKKICNKSCLMNLCVIISFVYNNYD